MCPLDRMDNVAGTEFRDRSRELRGRFACPRRSPDPVSVKSKGSTAYSEHGAFRVRDNAVRRGFSGMCSHLYVLPTSPNAEYDQIGSYSSGRCDDRFTRFSVREERLRPAPELAVLGHQLVEVAQQGSCRWGRNWIRNLRIWRKDYVKQSQASPVFLRQ